MITPARQMRLQPPTSIWPTIGWIARQFTTVVLATVIVALLVGSAMAIGSFICNDVPRIVGGATAALAEGGLGPGW